MKLLVCTNEYPPNVYGGAGIHVANLVAGLTKTNPVEVRCFSQTAPVRAFHRGLLTVNSYGPAKHTRQSNQKLRKILDTLDRNNRIAADPTTADLVHCHTWYTLLAGLLLKQTNGIPLVITAHSVEPRRPWKAAQLGEGYKVSSWIEQTVYPKADAVIAVSKSLSRDIQKYYKVPAKRIHVIPNGVDTKLFRPVDPMPALKKYGINPTRPYILFVGRITKQKGIEHLLNAMPHIDSELQLVLCASSPDTPQLEKKIETLVKKLQRSGKGVIWISKNLPQEELRLLYSGATAFVSPSIYEPFGMINTEAMACGCPVVSTRVGGIPDVVIHGKTGLLVDVHAKSEKNLEPANPERFAKNLASAINQLASNPALRERMSKAGIKRARKYFSWDQVIKKTIAVYKSIL